MKNPTSALGEHCQKYKLVVHCDWQEDKDSNFGRWTCTVQVKEANGKVVVESSRQDGKKSEAKKMASRDCFEQLLCPSTGSVAQGTHSSFAISTLASQNQNGTTKPAHQKRGRRLIEIVCAEEERLEKLQHLVSTHAKTKNFSCVIFAPHSDGDGIAARLREDPTLHFLRLDVVDAEGNSRDVVQSSIEKFWRGATSVLVACPTLPGFQIAPDCRLIVQYAPKERNKGMEVDVKSMGGGAFNAAHALHVVFLSRSQANKQDDNRPRQLGDDDKDRLVHQQQELAPSGQARSGIQSDATLTESICNGNRSAEPSTSTSRDPSTKNRTEPKRPYAIPTSMQIRDASKSPTSAESRIALHVHELQIQTDSCDCPAHLGGNSPKFCIVAAEPLAGVPSFTLHPPLPDTCQHLRRVTLLYRGVEYCQPSQVEEGYRYYQRTSSALADLSTRGEGDGCGAGGEGGGAEGAERAAGGGGAVGGGGGEWDGFGFAVPLKDGGTVDWDQVGAVNAWFGDIASRRKRTRRAASDGVATISSGSTMLWARYLTTGGKLSDLRPYLFSRQLESTVGSVKPRCRFATREEWEVFFAEKAAAAEAAGEPHPTEEQLEHHERFWASYVDVLKALPLGYEEAEAWRDLRMIEGWPLLPGMFKSHQPSAKTAPPATHRLIPAAPLCQTVPLPAMALCLPSVVATLHRLALPAQLARTLLGPEFPPPPLMLHACTTPQGRPGPCKPYRLEEAAARWVAVDSGPGEQWGEQDYQRLEFVGDSFLHVAVTLCLALRGPEQGHQRLVQRLMRRVGNATLTQLAVACGLPLYMLNEAKFIPGRGPGERFDAGYEREVHGKTTCADVLEAVVGACWLEDAPERFATGCAWRATVALGVLGASDVDLTVGFQRLAEHLHTHEARVAEQEWLTLPTAQQQADCLGHHFSTPTGRMMLAAAVLHPHQEQVMSDFPSLLFVVGDSVSKGVLSRWLADLRPTAAQGGLTCHREGLWSADAMSRAALTAGVHRWVQTTNADAAVWLEELERYAQAVQGGVGGDTGPGTGVDEEGVGVEEPKALNRLMRKLIGAVLLDSVLESGLRTVLEVCAKVFATLMQHRVTAPTQSSTAAVGGDGGWVNAMRRLDSELGQRMDVQHEWLGCSDGRHSVQVWVDGQRAGRPGQGDSFLSAKVMASAAALESVRAERDL